jgi:hypothetical protein
LASRSRSSTPVNGAVEMYGPPTLSDTQVMVIVRVIRSMSITSSKVSVSSRSTRPWMRSVQSSARSRGTDSAVSIR